MLDELLKEARGWLTDCGDRVPDETPALILKVNRNYDGGWQEFVRADPDAIPSGVRAELALRFPKLDELLYPAPDPTPTGDPLPILG